MSEIFSINIPRINRVAKCQRIDNKDLESRLGSYDTMRINFIPSMFYALACDEALELCDRAATLRLKELRPYTRKIRENVRSYAKSISDRVGESAAIYQRMIERYNETITTDRWLAVLKLQEDARNQLPGHDELICAHLCLMLMLVEFAYEFEKNVARRLTEEFSQEMKRVSVNLERSILDAANAAKDLASVGYFFNPSKQALLSVKVLANRAYALSDKIIDEELNLQNEQ